MKHLISIRSSGLFSFYVNIMELPTWPDGAFCPHKTINELIKEGFGDGKRNYAIIQTHDDMSITTSVGMFQITDDKLILTFNAYTKNTSRHNGYHLTFDIGDDTTAFIRGEIAPEVMLSAPLSFSGSPWQVDEQFLDLMIQLNKRDVVEVDSDKRLYFLDANEEKVFLDEERWRPTCSLYINWNGDVRYRNIITKDLIDYYFFALKGKSCYLLNS